MTKESRNFMYYFSLLVMVVVVDSDEKEREWDAECVKLGKSLASSL